jgi:hypothetical protein
VVVVGVAEAGDDAADEVVPPRLVGTAEAGGALEEQAEGHGADEVEDGFGVDVGGDGAVGDGRVHDRLDGGAPPGLGLGDGGGDVGLAAGGDERLEADGLVVAQRLGAQPGEALDEVGDPRPGLAGAEVGDPSGAGDDRLPEEVVLGPEAPVGGAVESPASLTMSWMRVPE